jgi:hypothetical protein
MWADARLDERFDRIDTRFDNLDRTLERVDRDIREVRTEIRDSRVLMFQLWGSTMVAVLGTLATVIATNT